MISSERVLKAIDWCAQRVYRAADRLLVISDGFRRNLISKGIAADKIEGRLELGGRSTLPPARTRRSV